MQEGRQIMQNVIDVQTVKYAVQRQIICQLSGKVLDWRKAVAIETYNDGKLINTTVVTGEAFDSDVKANVEQITEANPGLTLKVYDGREISKR